VAVLAGTASGIGTGVAVSRWGRRRTIVPIAIGTIVATGVHLPLACGDGGLLATTAVVTMSVVYCAQVTWVCTVCMDLSRGSAAATDFTVQTWVMGILRMVLPGPALLLAGQFGYPWLITGALGIACAGAALTVLWARSHPVP
jgi:hypothetical protein